MLEFPRVFRRALSSRTALVFPVFFALAGGVAFADGTVQIDGIKFNTPGGDAVTMKSVVFEGTNLSADEIRELLTPGGDDHARIELLAKLKATHISIPEIEAVKGAEIGHIKGISARDVEEGKVGAAEIAGFDFVGKGTEGKPIAFKCGAVHMSGADLAGLLAMAQGKSEEPSNIEVESLSLENFDLTGPDDEHAAQGETFHIALASMEAHNSYAEHVFKSGSAKVKGLLIEGSKGTQLTTALAPFGYQKLILNMSVAGRYDPATKKLSIDDFSVGDAKMGTFSLKASADNIAPEMFQGDKQVAMGAAMAAKLTGVDLKYVDSGLFEKVTAMAAGQQNVPPADFKKQMAAMAGAMVPQMLGGDANAVKLGAEAQKFITTPKSLAVSVRAKSGGFGVMDAATLGNPADAIKLFDIKAVANQ